MFKVVVAAKPAVLNIRLPGTSERVAGRLAEASGWASLEELERHIEKSRAAKK